MSLSVNDAYHLHIPESLWEPYHLHFVDSVDLDENVPARHYLGVGLNLANVAVSQFRGYNFNSFCKLAGGYLGANEHGVYSLDDAQTDHDAQIDAFFKLTTTDLLSAVQKRLRRVLVGYETNGAILFKITNDEGNEREYELEAADPSLKQHGNRRAIGRNGKGRYWTLRIENVRGCDFSVDSIDLDLVALGRKPSGG